MQVQLNTRVNVEIMKKLNEYAKKSGRSKASIVEAALKEYLDRNEKSPGK